MAVAFEARPLTPQTRADLEALFDLPGGSIVRGCWCMYYRRSGKVSVSAAAGKGNKQQLRAAVRYARGRGVRMLEAYPVDLVAA